MASIPSVAFAAMVFACGWLDVSPFASWPLGLVILLCAPSMVPFLLLVRESALRFPAQVRRRSRAARPATFLPQEKFRWGSVLTRRRAIVLGVLTVVVFFSFFSAMGSYRGSPEVIDGQLVFTDHGKVLGPATQRDADEARTRESRIFTGHLMLFGMVGLLAQVPPQTGAASGSRPGPTGRRLRNRPPGRRPQPADDDPESPAPS